MLQSPWLQRLLATEWDVVPLILRLALGIQMGAHGAQKVFGWFGGDGLQQSMQGMTHFLGIPALLAGVAILTESVGSLGLLLGLGGRLAALAIGVEMVVAAYLVHMRNGFFMNWRGNQAGEGFEIHLLMIAIAAALVLRGSGAWSLDHILAQRIASPWRPGHRASHEPARAA